MEQKILVVALECWLLAGGLDDHAAGSWRPHPVQNPQKGLNYREIDMKTPRPEVASPRIGPVRDHQTSSGAAAAVDHIAAVLDHTAGERLQNFC